MGSSSSSGGEGRGARFWQWLRQPTTSAKAIEFTGLQMQVEMLALMGRPVPPDIQKRYDELLKWYIKYTGKLPPRH